MSRTVEQWLIIAPRGVFEAVMDVVQERSRHEAHWPIEHDDEHGPEHLRKLAAGFVGSAQGDSEFQRSARRERMVKSAALLLAAIEVIDRHPAETTWPLPVVGPSSSGSQS